MKTADSWSRRLAAGSGLLVLGRLFDIGVNSLSLIVVARALGPDEFGVLGFATAAASLVYTLTDLGLTRAYVHTLSQASDLQGHLSTFFFMRLPILVLGVIVTVGLAFWWPGGSGLHGGVVILAVMLAAWSLRALASVGQVTLEAQQRILASQSVAWAYTGVYALVVPVVAWVTRDAQMAAVANLAPALSAFLIGLAYLREIGFGRPKWPVALEYIRYAVPLVGAAVVGGVAEYVDRLLLQVSWGTTAVGEYTAAQRVVNPISGLWSAASNFLLATVVRGRAGGQTAANVVGAVHDMDAIASVLLVSLIAPVIVDASAIMELLLGSPYRDAGPTLALLAVQVWAEATNYPAVMLLLGAGRSRAYGMMSATLSAVLILLLIVVVPRPELMPFGRGLGLVGAGACLAIISVLGLLSTELLAATQYGIPFRISAFVNLGVAILATFAARSLLGDVAPAFVRVPIEGAASLGLVGAATAVRLRSRR
jgi:O-antigen/teichoic acid export membrane protein